MDRKPTPGERPINHLRGLVEYPDPPEGDERVWIKGQPLPTPTERYPEQPRSGGWADRLYPASALGLLALEASGEGNFTGLIDEELKSWIAGHARDPISYLSELAEALQQRRCVDGLCARLNLACLTEPTTDTTLVSTARGVTRISRPRPGLDWLPRHAHRPVRQFCHRVGWTFLYQAREVAQRLEALNSGYDLEQIMLVRISYLAAHAQLGNRQAVPVPRALEG